MIVWVWVDGNGRMALWAGWVAVGPKLLRQTDGHQIFVKFLKFL